MENFSLKRFFERHWEKMALWTILIGLFYLLKPFFLLIFEIFLITFITKHIAEWIAVKWRWNYRAATVAVFLVFVSLIGLAAAWIGPKLVIESNRIVSDFAGRGQLETRDDVNQLIRNALIKVAGEERADRFLQSQQYTVMKTALRAETTKAVESLLPKVLDIVVMLFKVGWQIFISLILAIIFSFILVMDWNQISAKMQRLENSRIRSFYLGAAPHLQAFGGVLGKNFSVQAIIAACNTVLTAIGLLIFHVPNVALLATIVFICGFIPILGTFISAIPIVLFAMQVGGLVLILKLLIVIAVVHAVEAYVLNPRIAAGFYHVHPILILVLLLVGERFFGVWGMVVGVPVGYYIISVLTKQDECLAPDSKEKC